MNTFDSDVTRKQDCIEVSVAPLGATGGVTLRVEKTDCSSSFKPSEEFNGAILYAKINTGLFCEFTLEYYSFGTKPLF